MIFFSQLKTGEKFTSKGNLYIKVPEYFDHQCYCNSANAIALSSGSFEIGDTTHFMKDHEVSPV